MADGGQADGRRCIVLLMIRARVVAASAVMASGCGGSPPEPGPGPFAATEPVAEEPGVHPLLVEPDLDGLRVILARHRRFRFDEAAQARGCPAEESLGEYVKRLVKYGSPIDDGDVHRLSGGCGPFPKRPIAIDPPADDAYWYCYIEAYASDPAGASPWHYELRVRVSKLDRAADLSTVACPGTS